MKTVYPSKIDTWLGAVLILAVVVQLLSCVVVLWVMHVSGLAIALPLLVLSVLPVWLLRGTNYTLDATHLLVRSGPFKWQVKLADITRITPTSNPLSSPALSLDRLNIEYGSGHSVMISPLNKQQFIRAIDVLRAIPPQK